MNRITEGSSDRSRLVWEQLEGWGRKKAQELIQRILEEEVTELLGRQKSERRQAVYTRPPTVMAMARSAS